MKLHAGKFVFITAAASTASWTVFKILQEVFVPSQPERSKFYLAGIWPEGLSFVKIFSIFLISLAVAWLIIIVLNGLLRNGRKKR